MTSKSIHPYVYKIVDSQTGEFYIGSRYGNVSLGLTPEEDFLVKYFSSGKFESRLRENSSSFECSIIFRSGEPEVAYWYEQLLIRENIKNPMCANGYYMDPDTGSKMFSMTGATHSTETRQKISSSMTGKCKSSETRHRMSTSKIGRSNGPLSMETRQKMSLAKKGKPAQIVVCPHCNKSGGIYAMKQWHFNNCKLIKNQSSTICLQADLAESTRSLIHSDAR